MPTTTTRRRAHLRLMQGTVGTLAVGERMVRVATGLVLFAFVSTHLLNHAAGIFGVAVMEHVQTWRMFVWRSWPGTVLLYGSLLLHVLLALKRALSRRSLKMPRHEAVQIALGLTLPIMLWPHIVGSRYMAEFAGVSDAYRDYLPVLWPALAVSQSILVVIAWGHGVLGLYFLMQPKPWFPRWRTAFHVVAILVPVLALAGFVAAGRESHGLPFNPRTVAEAHQETIEFGRLLARSIAYTIVGVAVAVFLWREVVRRLSPSVDIRYVGHGSNSGPLGLTLLEISRLNGIPHPSICGGRGRCSTCRVLVLSSSAELPPPGPIERRALRRIGAPERVRLACQLRPRSDMRVRVLLPVGSGHLDDHEELRWGVERDVCILFADVRGFSGFEKFQLADDIVVFLNRIIGDVRQAIHAHGGRSVSVQTDGVMGIFGLTPQVRNSGRAAIEAAFDILRGVETTNRELTGLLPQPLRIGIGIHSGRAIVAAVGSDAEGDTLSVIGEPAFVASRLEEATKELMADVIVTESTLAAAGLNAAVGQGHTISYKSGHEPVLVRTYADIDDVARLLGRTHADS